ncbi:hypothetical protein JL720_15110 [Aureococcus anophagefferens]|nr:hypothetical protein JL720_15110 [Aureococcus anophagefferens]
MMPFMNPGGQPPRATTAAGAGGSCGAMNPLNMPPVAGVTTKLGGQTTEACLHLDERPGTPPGVRKWRKSNYTQPGQRIIHPGLIEDFKDANHTAERFGKIKIVSDHVEDVLVQPGAESEFAQVKLTQKESTYHSIKREPLGQSFTRGHVLPSCVAEPGFQFGKKSVREGGDGSKVLIYNPRTRGYDWGGRDMNAHRFGVGDGSHVALNGLALGASAALRQGMDTEPITSTRVQNFNSLQDKLGKTRNLGHGNHRPRDHLYGKASVRGFGEWDARCCITGDYAEEDREPDSDLGKTHTPGFRNILTDAQKERTFGTPTLCAMGIDENEFFAKRPKADICDLFTAIGWNLDDDKFHDDVCDDDGMTNIGPSGRSSPTPSEPAREGLKTTLSTAHPESHATPALMARALALLGAVALVGALSSTTRRALLRGAPAAALTGASTRATAADEENVAVYFGVGCFWHVQHEFAEAERAILGRDAFQWTALAGYAGGRKAGKDASRPGQSLVCYHNPQRIADYGKLGHGEVVGLKVPPSTVGKFAEAYAALFDASGDRPDKGDRGGEYRSSSACPAARPRPSRASWPRPSRARA